MWGLTLGWSHQWWQHLLGTTQATPLSGLCLVSGSHSLAGELGLSPLPALEGWQLWIGQACCREEKRGAGRGVGLGSAVP